MSVVDPILGEMAGTEATSEVFALTDEQIVGMGDDEGANRGDGDVEVLRNANDASLRMTNAGTGDGQLTDGAEAAAGAKSRLEAGATKAGSDGKSAQAGMDAALEPPEWLAERMRDPRYGEEAKELWDGKQRAEKEAAAYREVFATAADARALKEIYPGGLSEAKSAAERARTLDEIDAAFYRGDAPARVQLAQRMMAQDPAAFREMVEAGVRLLGGVERKTPGELNGVRAAENLPGSLRSADDVRAARTEEKVGRSGRDDSGVVEPEVARAYGAFEKAANAELEKSVGGAIARMMEEALPNLRQLHTPGQAGAQHAAPLRERLAGAVREEVEAALKSDGQLGEQVSKILAVRRFEDATRAQVVRLIDARAQQLVPGAVRRVVGSWTQATLGANGTGRRSAGGELEELGDGQRRVGASAARQDGGRAAAGRNEKQSAAGRSEGMSRGRRMDYRKISDEEILGL